MDGKRFLLRCNIFLAERFTPPGGRRGAPLVRLGYEDAGKSRRLADFPNLSNEPARPLRRARFG